MSSKLKRTQTDSNCAKSLAFLKFYAMTSELRPTQTIEILGFPIGSAGSHCGNSLVLNGFSAMSSELNRPQTDSNCGKRLVFCRIPMILDSHVVTWWLKFGFNVDLSFRFLQITSI